MLAAIGLGNVIQNVLGLSIVIGLNAAIETLVSQAYGSGNMRLCGEYLNRGRVIALGTFFPLSIILLNCKTILIAIGQNETVSHLAQQYITTYLPGLILMGLIDGQRRFLAAMGRTTVAMYVQAVGGLLHILWCHVFFVHYDMGISGIGVAGIITNLSIYLSMLFYTSSIESI
mmetsp:Transcript_5539/g.8708  ORF Transcript_5539/g.8708 Transcript_5539/m.8708 type:complete len:173 (-) Transcript_5539:639-1157(-)|eukprot:CAMPEP_0170486356 /NCGR_PEP_ID=MMETSP0208-20121228/5400_1 /TAXON_ID=197538 /ORGANISM="Strombidium inclinatum, Strain S3" /LENGTH=172 /DNA_ID=CAMNT_0010760271 /DNA_START=276 /DNA_END=794 /DNA_ORIENTATION=+